MRIVNDFDSNTFLIGKVLKPQEDYHDYKYFTVLLASDCPALITDYVAHELFATGGGKVRFIYVVRPFAQVIEAPDNFIHMKQILRARELSTKPSAGHATMYIMQFMAYDKLVTDVFPAETDLAAAKEMLRACNTARRMNTIKAFVSKKFDINDPDNA